VTDYSRVERLALCDLFDEVGPTAPTLCEGWDAFDLAAHLYVREADPMAGPGLMISALADTTERRMQRAKERYGFAGVVGKIRNGPPAVSLFAVPKVGAQLNTTEYFVHHEDVRRAQPGWAPRELAPQLEGKLWAALRRSARLMFRKAPTGIVLIAEGQGRYAARLPDQHGTVVLRGTPAELVLYAYGRKEVARVEFQGDADDIAALQEAELGIS
jgi:uncharacterized protein (TIGR03085 family)